MVTLLMTAVLASVQISWDEVKLNSDGTPCVDLAGYTLYVEEQSPTGPKVVTQVFDQEAYKGISIDPFLAEGKSYRVWVDAFDASGNHSGPSNVLEITVPDVTPPAAPQNLHVVQ